MRTVNRRDFMRNSIGTAALLALLPARSGRAAGDKVVVGVMGLGGRGRQLAQMFAARADVEVAYLCDVDKRRSQRAAEAVTQAQNKKPRLVQDFRRMLDDRDLDAVINATPDHWHALGTIRACQAGKDVYVEKPMAHNPWEGRKMIEAARKYKRVVQVGTQTRSAPYVLEAVDRIRSGRLGDVHAIRVFNMMRHSPMRAGSVQPVPDELDYDMWCGPAAKLPYNPSRRWLNFREYSCGPIAGDAIHQLDLARMLIGDKPYPDTVAHAGGITALQDGRDMPDTQFALYEYGSLTLIFQAALWTPYMKKTPQSIRNSDGFPDWPFSSTKIEVLGTKGFMYLGRHGGGWEIRDSDGKVTGSRYGRQADKEHQDNFVECIRTRKRANADVEQGHYSTLLCHLANISWWAGNQKLRLDPKTETFVDDPAANQHRRRTYRPQWRVPDDV